MSFCNIPLGQDEHRQRRLVNFIYHRLLISRLSAGKMAGKLHAESRLSWKSTTSEHSNFLPGISPEGVIHISCCQKNALTLLWNFGKHLRTKEYHGMTESAPE